MYLSFIGRWPLPCHSLCHYALGPFHNVPCIHFAMTSQQKFNMPLHHFLEGGVLPPALIRTIWMKGGGMQLFLTIPMPSSSSLYFFVRKNPRHLINKKEELFNIIPPPHCESVIRFEFWRAPMRDQQAHIINNNYWGSLCCLKK